MNSKKFIHLDEAGNNWGIASAEQMWAKVYAIKYNRPEKKLERNDWLKLLSQAKLAAIEFGAEVIDCRIRLEYEPHVFKSIFKELGFAKRSGRIEFKCDVKDLSGEEGTPFIWKTAKELHWSHKEIADFTKQIVKEALDVDPNEKPEDFMQDWLNHDELICGTDCISIGFLDEAPCALSVVQTAKDLSWSRISYMGLIPSFRGKGLGKWVHRHGFQMMKSQGGNLYHGGTLTNNFPMRKLFESHGCVVYCEMEEWELKV